MEDDFVVWDDSYSVGFELIDDQHKELVVMTNELFQGCKGNATTADVAFLRAVKKAVDYAQSHFSTEEKYMQQVNYPFLKEHKIQHDDFVSEVKKAVHNFEEGNAEPIEMARFLKNWLLNHIAQSDKQYGPYLAGVSM